MVNQEEITHTLHLMHKQWNPCAGTEASAQMMEEAGAGSDWAAQPQSPAWEGSQPRLHSRGRGPLPRRAPHQPHLGLLPHGRPEKEGVTPPEKHDN